MSIQGRLVDAESAAASEHASEFPMYVAPKASDNADILDPEFPGEGTGKTQMHDQMIETGLVAAPAVHMTEDEYQLMILEELEGVDKFARVTRADLERIEDAGGDDDDLEQLRRRRLEELQRKREEELKLPRFNGVQPVDEQSFEREVKEFSQQFPVVMLLWRDASPECARMRHIIDQLAARHRRVKFCTFLVRESGDVAGFPLQHCPTLMCYRGGQVAKQFVKLVAFDGMNTTAEDVEWELAELQLLETELTEDPRVLRRLGVRRAELAKFTKRPELQSSGDEQSDDDSGDDSDDRGPRRGGFVFGRR